MEPADIDWKNVNSRSIRDEVFEYIDAPKWLDLSAPDGDPTVDDVAFFCRPGCRHPKTAENFQRSEAVPSPKAILLRSSSERLPFGEKGNTLRDTNKLNKQAGIPVFLPTSSPLRPKAAAAPKKHRADLENQDPNQVTSPPREALAFGVCKEDKAAKKLVKSCADKKVPEGAECQQKKTQPRLKSTLSARNLFSGKDILSHISEFCHELKKMASGIRKSSSAKEQEHDAVQRSPVIVPAIAAVEETELVTPIKENRKCKKNGEMAVLIEVEKKAFDENSALLKKMRDLPPTPQRFPSASSHGQIRNLKSTSANAGSPLKKPRKSTSVKGSILREVQERREEKRTLLPPVKDEGSKASVVTTDIEEGGGGGPVDLFWFLKPCTYLVK